MIVTGTEADVLTIASLPPGSQVAILRQVSPGTRAALIQSAQKLQRGGLNGLGFLPSIAAFLFSAAKVAGTVATTAVSAGVANALAPKPVPTVVSSPVPQASSSNKTMLWVLGGVAVLALLATSGKRGGRRGRR